MRDSAFDWPLPFEAEIAVAGLHRQSSYFCRFHAGPMHVELLVAEAVGKADRTRHQFGAHHLRIEFVRALPLRDMDYAVIELGRHRHIAHLYLRMILSDIPSPAEVGVAKAGDWFPLFGIIRYPFCRISRPRSRSQERFFSVSRLSCSFLPLPSAISIFARPFSLK